MQVLSCVRPQLMASDTSTIDAVAEIGTQHDLDIVPSRPTGDVLFVRAEIDSHFLLSPSPYHMMRSSLVLAASRQSFPFARDGALLLHDKRVRREQCHAGVHSVCVVVYP